MMISRDRQQRILKPFLVEWHPWMGIRKFARQLPYSSCSGVINYNGQTLPSPCPSPPLCLPSVHLMSLHKTRSPRPSLSTLQATKNWSQGRPGNKVIPCRHYTRLPSIYQGSPPMFCYCRSQKVTKALVARATRNKEWISCFPLCTPSSGQNNNNKCAGFVKVVHSALCTLHSACYV